MTNVTTEQLWAVQLEEFPNSIRLEPGEVIEWAFNNHRRCNSVLMSIQYPIGVFYRIPIKFSPGEEFRGFRFGLEGREYLGFAD